MTESQWLTSDDPVAMVLHLTCTSWQAGPDRPVRHRRRSEPLTSARKLRLFAAACWRHNYLSRPLSPPGTPVDCPPWEAVRYAEELADGRSRRADDPCADSPCTMLDPDANHAAQAAAENAAWNYHHSRLRPQDLAVLLRDVVGCLPLRPAVGRRGGAESWLTPLVLDLATAAYEQRRRQTCGRCRGRTWVREQVPPGRGNHHEFTCPDCRGEGGIDAGPDPARLAVLSDAMEEAGCGGDAPCGACGGCGRGGGRVTDGLATKWSKILACAACAGRGRTGLPLLEHLRSPLPHCRGCWVLDLLLGKE